MLFSQPKKPVPGRNIPVRENDEDPDPVMPRPSTHDPTKPDPQDPKKPEPPPSIPSTPPTKPVVPDQGVAVFSP